MKTKEDKAMEAMNEMTVFEMRMLAVEGFRAVIGNGQLFAVVPDDKKSTEHWERVRVENGY